MTTVAKLPQGQWIMTYEFYGAVEADFAVYYRVSDDPLNFNASEGHVVESEDGTVPVSSPYVVWTPYGGANGTIAVSSGTNQEVFLNRNLDASGLWDKVPCVEGISYTRNLRVLPDNSTLLVTGAGVLSGSNNSVTTSTLDLTSVAPASRLRRKF